MNPLVSLFTKETRQHPLVFLTFIAVTLIVLGSGILYIATNYFLAV